MPPSSKDPAERDERRRIAQQLQLIRDGMGEGRVESDTLDEADYSFLFVPGRVLVDRPRFDAAVEARGSVDPPLPDLGAREDRDGLEDGLESWELPVRSDSRSQDVVEALQGFDNLLGRDVVTPEHYVHVAAIGNGRACPATEPTETGRTQAWPPKNTRADAGRGVRVHVIDTGWMPASQDASRPLPAYAGHGSFAEAVVKCRAPRARVTHSEFPMQGGAILETDLANAIRDAVTVKRPPQVISLSAGCHTRNDRPLKAFQMVWRKYLKHLPDTVLVAAAGNDCSPSPFYPAASKWAIGVGSLDNNGRVSSYSNYLKSADVFVLGRNHVNKYPRGTYMCHEAPDDTDERVFRTGWARWSGTSFATPLMSGMIAVHIEETGLKARAAARDLIKTRAQWRHGAVYGDYRRIGPDQYT
jgi:hypothetical protein